MEVPTPNSAERIVQGKAYSLLRACSHRVLPEKQPVSELDAALL